MSFAVAATDLGSTYPNVRKALRLQQYVLRNRIVLPPMDTNWSDAEGRVTERHVRFYGAVSDGGCAMVIVGSTAVAREGRAGSGILRADLDEYAEGLRGLSTAIRAGGAVAGIQLFHAGAQGNPVMTGERIVAPERLFNPYANTWAEPLSASEIVELEEKYGDAAGRCVQAGFQVLEVHTAHGYLLHQFLSPRTNHRQDEYGGSTRNRARIVLNILARIRERVGPDVPVGVRISGDDFIEDGLCRDLHAELLPLLLEAGIAYVHVTAGVHESSRIKHEKMSRGEIALLSGDIRRMVDVPVIAVGRVLTLEHAEALLHDGIADLVAMGRAQIADPALVGKCLRGQRSDVRWCRQTNHCAFLRFGRSSMSCGVNSEV